MGSAQSNQMKNHILELLVEIQRDVIIDVLKRFNTEVSKNFIKAINELWNSSAPPLREQVSLASELIDKQLVRQKPAEVKSDPQISMEFISPPTLNSLNQLIQNDNGIQLIQKFYDLIFVCSTKLTQLPSKVSTDADVKAIFTVLTKFYELSDSYSSMTSEFKSDLEKQILFKIIYDAIDLVSNKYLKKSEELTKLPQTDLLQSRTLSQETVKDKIKTVYDSIVNNYRESVKQRPTNDQRASEITASNNPNSLMPTPKPKQHESQIIPTVEYGLIMLP